MPTAADFDQAAAVFDRVADEAAFLLAGTRDRLGPDVLRGGRLALVVDATLDTVSRMTAQVSIDSRSLADTCRSRAEQCRLHLDALAAHQQAVRRWERDVRLAATEGALPAIRRPPRPRPPHAWIEI